MTTTDSGGNASSISFALSNAQQLTGVQTRRPPRGRPRSQTQADPLEYAGGAFSLYAYAGDDPINEVDPYGLWGAGIIGSVSGEVGIGYVGGGGTGSVAAGIFGGGAECTNVGAFKSFGAFAGGDNWGPTYAPMDPNSLGNTTQATGGFVGTGAGLFLTNATSVNGDANRKMGYLDHSTPYQ